MEPFALICTTCKSRLKVRDAAAIGQIMACPKCGGMVLVKPPEPGASPPLSHDTGETKPDLSQPLRPLPPVNPANYQISANAFDDVDALLGNVTPRNMVPTPTVRPTANSPQAKAQHTPHLPPPLGQSVIKPPDQKQNPDSQAKTVSQNDIPVDKLEAWDPLESTCRHASLSIL